MVASTSFSLHKLRLNVVKALLDYAALENPQVCTVPNLWINGYGTVVETEQFNGDIATIPTATEMVDDGNWKINRIHPKDAHYRRHVYHLDCISMSPYQFFPFGRQTEQTLPYLIQTLKYSPQYLPGFR
jgi:hypothetical protein